MPKKPIKEDIYYAVVDQVEINALGQISVKEPRFRMKFLPVNIQQKTEGGVVTPAQYDLFGPDEAGIYSIKTSDKYSAERADRLEFMKKRYPAVLIGPFKEYTKAITAQYDSRKKLANEENVLLKKDNQAQTEELVALRQKIAAMESGATASPTLPDTDSAELGLDETPSGPENPEDTPPKK